MEEISVTGGARIGLVNASWPLAKLAASSTHLRLSGLLGVYNFLPGEVVALERFGSIPVLYSGMRIRHSRPDYPAKIIFWYLGDVDPLIERIRQVGFLPAAPAASETKWRGFSIRWTAVLLFLLAWNGLFLLDRAALGGGIFPPGLFSLLAILLTFLLCWGAKASPDLQALILRDGHSVGEIRAFLSLLEIVSGLLLLVFGILILTHAFVSRVGPPPL